MYKRAGPAQINGPDSAQKGRLGRPRPNKNLGRSQPNLKFFFSLGQARPIHAKPVQHRAGPAKKPQRGENYFSPPRPPPACRTILHAGGKRLQLKRPFFSPPPASCMQKTVPGVEEAVVGRSCCCCGARWRPALMVFLRCC